MLTTGLAYFFTAILVILGLIFTVVTFKEGGDKSGSWALAGILVSLALFLSAYAFSRWAGL